MPAAPSTPAVTRPWTPWLQLLRWDRPTGRLILLLPAGWSLWLASPSPPPTLVGLILLGGLAVSGAGCIANDLWDRRIDAAVERTRDRPLARGAISPGPAFALLLVCLLLALLVVLALPAVGRPLSLGLALLTLPPVLLYPSAKRWCPLPQLVLALCWGFAVLIPWAALRGDLAGGWPLVACWGATLAWTFGFDTVYAMADRDDDRRLGVRSSALTLGGQVVPAVAVCYALAWLLLLSAAWGAGMGPAFWPLALLAGLALGRECRLLVQQEASGRPLVARHFSRQVRIGALLLLALILGRVG
ncbi:MAG: 4-hydroxybenzoate polyprenyltransferase [Cyanobacteriota bacterium]